MIVGQAALVRHTLITLLAGGNALLEGVPGLGKTLLVRTLARGDRLPLPAHPVHPRPDARRHRRHHPAHRGRGRAGAPSSSSRGRSSPTSCSPTRSTAPRRRPSRPSWRRCRSTRSRSPRRCTCCPRPSSCSPRRTRSRWRAPTRCPRRSSTASSSRSTCRSPPSRSWRRSPTARPGVERATVEPVATGDADPRRCRNWPAGCRWPRHVTARRRPARRGPRHPDDPDAPAEVRRYVRYGASPRGMQALILAGKIHALLDGRFNVAFDDLRDVAAPGAAPPADPELRGPGRGHRAGRLVEEVIDE